MKRRPPSSRPGLLPLFVLALALLLLWPRSSPPAAPHLQRFGVESLAQEAPSPRAEPRPSPHAVPPAGHPSPRFSPAPQVTHVPPPPAGPPAGHGPWNWLAVADCESGDHDGLRPYTADWHVNGLYDGGLQFDPGTWRRAGGLRYASYAYLASPSEQIAVADSWARAIGGPWQSAGWPKCGRFA